MKNFFKFLLLAVITINLTSCYEFRRKQDYLDAENRGKSILIEAESSKKAMIEEARAENEAAELKAESRIKIAEAKKAERILDAEGVAEANRIIGQSLKGNSEYLQYLLIQTIDEGDRVYIPTEAGLPILEVGK